MMATELIRKLQELVAQNGDHEVMTEGCDCIGDSKDVEFNPPYKTGRSNEHSVEGSYLITRSC